MLTLPPVKGDISLAGVLPLAGVGGSSRTRVIVVVVVEYIIILIIIIVVLLDFAQLQFCQTVHLESLLFFKPLVFPRKVMGRQIGALCCWRVFLWPGGQNLIFVLQNSTPGGVGEPLPRTLSQMRVSRDQNFINCCCKMSICTNSLWNSCKSGINIEAHALGSHQLADHFPMRLPIEADLDPFKTQVLEHLCPGFVEHSHKSHLPEHSSELMS